MNTELKFCKDCRYCEPDPTPLPEDNALKYARCRHPNACHVRPDLVSGETRDVNQYCISQRTSPLDYHCGEEGKNFEAAS